MADELLTCGEALAMVLEHAAQTTTLQTETVPLTDSSARVLAYEIKADRDQPPFHRSTRDGFAVQAAAIMTGARLCVTGTLRAGEVWNGHDVTALDAVQIMTGAPLPEGADAVVMLEHVTHAEGSIHLHEGRSLAAGDNVVPRGAEATSGQMLLNQGIRVTAAEVALAASVGAAEIEVYAQPRVAILATGDELVELGDHLSPHQIRNSNSHGIAALVRDAGGVPEVSAPVPDRKDAVVRAIEDARSADLLILSGGVSAGEYDFVEAALAEHGAEFFFTGVLMQPGKPVVFGRLPARGDHATQYFLGLPGNPVSTQVTFLLFAAPLLRALGGERNAAPRLVSAMLAEDVAVKPGLTRFLPAVLSSSLEKTEVRLTGWQGSGDLNANARANCYAVIPPDAEKLAAGTLVQVLLR